MSITARYSDMAPNTLIDYPGQDFAGGTSRGGGSMGTASSLGQVSQQHQVLTVVVFVVIAYVLWHLSQRWL